MYNGDDNSNHIPKPASTYPTKQYSYILKSIYNCETCLEKFTMRSSLLQHIETQHTLLENSSKCMGCEEYFTDFHLMKEHFEVSHSSVTLFYRCIYCASEFEDKYLLESHIEQIHMSINVCNTQNEVTNQNDDQIQINHVSKPAQNEIESLHRCTDCDAVYTRKDHLNRHFKVKHNTMYNGELHHCPQCHAPFRRKDHMVRHMKVKHSLYGEQTFPCNECPSKYRRKDHLQRHIKEKHLFKIYHNMTQTIERDIHTSLI